MTTDIGITQGQLNQRVRSALRQIWQRSRRSAFIKAVRVPHEGPGRGKWDVICTDCGKRMGQSEKRRVMLKSGKLSKDPKLVYQVDHIDGLPPLRCLEDILPFWLALMTGRQAVMCYECHQVKKHGKG